MHISKIQLNPVKYPNKKNYPFNLKIFNTVKEINLSSPITFFIGENGTGKSTLLEAIAHKCGIHIWKNKERGRVNVNHYEKLLYKYIDIKWTEKIVPGSFFASEIFRHFVMNLDDWASNNPGILKYFGNKSLFNQSHGQSHMSFFKNRFKIKGLFLLDEPENALAPKKQIQLLKLLIKMSKKGHAQFIIATHSPILLSCPEAEIYNFDNKKIRKINYKNTEYYKFYKDFLNNLDKYI